jgi:hypothetical protein
MESEPFQRRRSWRPVGVRGAPVMDTALDVKKKKKRESLGHPHVLRARWLFGDPGCLLASSPPAWRLRLARI